MSTLTPVEKRKLEKLFDMSAGYVSNFNNRTFRDFLIDAVKIDIDDAKYTLFGTSKANKFRSFWQIEADYLVGESIKELLKYTEENKLNVSNRSLIEECNVIADRLLAGKTVNLNGLKETAIVFDSKHLTEQIKRMEQSIEEDPSLAIGTAKELIETCCKTILAERGKPISGTPDIPTLTKQALKELKLVPDGIHESVRGFDIIRRLLQNLGTIGNGLAELRGLYGTGHGQHVETKRLSARHAKLAVGAASTLATFLFDTHKEVLS